jgi:hypothetical protein
MTASAPLDDDVLDRIDDLVARARDGADVAGEVAALPPAARAAAGALLHDLGVNTSQAVVGPTSTYRPAPA